MNKMFTLKMFPVFADYKPGTSSCSQPAVETFDSFQKLTNEGATYFPYWFASPGLRKTKTNPLFIACVNVSVPLFSFCTGQNIKPFFLIKIVAKIIICM